MSRTEVYARRSILAIGILFAVLASLEVDNTSMSLEFGATAAAFLTLAGLLALAVRMPSLPPLILPQTSLWQTRVRQARDGDGLARLHILEALESAATAGGLVDEHHLLDRREEVLGLPRKEFEELLTREVQRIEARV